MVSSQAPSSTRVKAPGGHWFEVDGLRLPRACGGHVALDFLNTYAGWGDATGRDYLATYDHLVTWASVNGLVEAPAAGALRRRAAARPAQSAEVLDDARRFRSDLRSVVLDPTGRRAMAAVNRHVSRALGVTVLEPAPSPGAPPRWAVGGGLERPLLAIAWSAAELLTREDLGAVHACPGDGCGWVFLDPRGRRRWCSMQWCGNRSKVRAHAERQRVAD